MSRKREIRHGGSGQRTCRGGRKPKEVIKEGLSEYFIYTIEGTETIPNGWSKRMRSFRGATVPFRIQYRYREPEYGDQLVRMYLLTNDKESKLGTTPLPDGMVRVFRDNGRDGLSFLVAQTIKYIPIGDKIELNLGPDPGGDLRADQAAQPGATGIWMQIHGANVFRRVDDRRVKIEVNSTVAGWDDHTVFTQRVRNYTEQADRRRGPPPFPGHIVFRSELEAAEPRLPDRPVLSPGRAGQDDRTCCTRSFSPGPRKEAEQRDDREGPR